MGAGFTPLRREKGRTKQLALMEAAYEQGFLDRSSELVNMSYRTNAEVPISLPR